VKLGSRKTLRTRKYSEITMKNEVSVKEELEKVTAEIARLERCKKVLEDTLAFEFLRRK